MTTTGIIGAGVSAASAVVGAIGSAIKNRQAKNRLQQRRDENRRWYEQESARDYTQRSDTQAILKRQRELLDERYKNARATNAVTGGSDEALAMQKKAANEAVADATTNIAGQATNYYQNLQNAYRQQDAALSQQQMQADIAQGNAIAQAAGQAVNAGLGLIGAEIGANREKKQTTNPNNNTSAS